jgi:nucleoid DNA-binding protein
MDAATEAGLAPVTCRDCGAKVATNDTFQRLFQIIMDRLRAGGTVQVKGFGTFRAKLLKGRTMSSSLVDGGKTSFGDKLLIKFHAAPQAKKYMSQDIKKPKAEKADPKPKQTKSEEKPAKSKKKAS